MNNGNDNKPMMKEKKEKKGEKKKDDNLLRNFNRPMLNIYCPYFWKLLG